MSQVHLKDYEQAQLNVIRRWLAHDEAGMAHLTAERLLLNLQQVQG
ncbi:hypothetical protein L5470_07725 [Synechococcus sp. PCC 6717]|nr:hypothetical protein [Synechococcus sp. PCC 6717]